MSQKGGRGWVIREGGLLQKTTSKLGAYKGRGINGEGVLKRAFTVNMHSIKTKSATST